jgi:Viral alkaline exonuclease
MAARVLTKEEKDVFELYSYNNYVKRLHCNSFRLSRNDILRVERATRLQSKNPLWDMLRLDRQTASGSSNAGRSVYVTEAMNYGTRQEDVVKQDANVISLIVSTIEKTLKQKVCDSILECGMFLSAFGLFSASPDAYFVMEDGTLVPVEIKCPFTYRDDTIEKMRATLKDRQPRYSVPHTAFTVNKRGAPLFVVEKTKVHYRQMQRQMYVMDAPMCVYVVKFGTEYVIQAVMRDQTFYLKQYETEQKLFDMLVNRNRLNKRFDKIIERKRTLIQHNYTDKQAHTLAERGLFFDYGHIKCIHCEAIFDPDSTIDFIMNRHHCSNSADYDNSTKAINASADNFAKHSKRVESLQKNNVNVHLASEGVYHDGSGLRTFCCGVPVKQVVVTHTPDCGYVKMLTE